MGVEEWEAREEVVEEDDNDDDNDKVEATAVEGAGTRGKNGSARSAERSRRKMVKSRLLRSIGARRNRSVEGSDLGVGKKVNPTRGCKGP